MNITASPITAARVTPLAQLLRDTLCTCIEGGSSYWLAGKSTRQADPSDTVGFFYTGIVECRDAEDRSEKFADVTLHTIEVGLYRIARGEVKVNKDIVAACVLALHHPDDADIDADCADAILQAGLFGELVYG